MFFTLFCHSVNYTDTQQGGRERRGQGRVESGEGVSFGVICDLGINISSNEN